MRQLRTIGAILVGLTLVAQGLRAQTSWTVQASQVAGIVNATTTRNTLVLTATSTSAGGDAAFLLNITSGGAATGTLQIYLQDSIDAGTTWNDLAAFAPFTFGAAAATQTLSLYSRTDGPGLIRSVAGSTPAAGAEISETVPTGARWELMAFKAQLVTDANVATRVVILRFDDGTTEYFRSDANFAHTAGVTGIYDWGQGLMTPLNGHVGGLLAGLPINLRLAGGHRIRTLTSSIQVGDQYSGIQYLVREWRDLPNKAVVTESIPAGQVRSGPWGDRIRVREVVSGVSGSPTGPTYTIAAVFR